MGEIRVLDKHIAELIAAGEVIERPASIVKELLENSIDAGATHITVEIKNGGIELIRVTDDGKGIAPEDTETAFLRHATSKIKTASDLDEIFTLGFRGEALASICAISRVSMITRKADSEIGCHVEIAGGELLSRDEAGCPVGTTIMVKNIFYNTPARMKFLKKDVSEANAVASIVEKIAISNPQIAFKFIRDGKIDLQTVGDGKLFSAIHSVFGKSFADTLLPVNFEKNGIKVEGFISKALNARAKRSMQYFFLNGRTVKNITMTVALEEAFKGSIMVGKFPACILNVSISPAIVDVNVHPTKTEVRFSDERIIYDAVYFASKTALSQDNAEADLILNQNVVQKSFSSAVKFKDFTTTGEQTKFNFSPKKEEKPEIANKIPQNVPTVDEQKVIVDIPKIEFNRKIDNTVVFKDDSASFGKNDEIKVSSTVSNPFFEEKNEKNTSVSIIAEHEFISEPKIEIKPEEPTIKDERFSGARIIGELFGTYILMECENSLYLVDKHAAHERLIYNKLKEQSGEIQRQYLLEAIIFKPAREEFDALIENKETVETLGFEVDDFGGGSVIVRSVPSFISSKEAITTISEIADNLKSCKKEVSPQLLDDIYHTIACRSAIKAHDKSSNYEREFLIECLRQETDVKYCPHGRPVTAKISKTEIEKRFGRIV